MEDITNNTAETTAEVVEFPGTPAEPVKQTFAVGVAITHIYSVPISAVSVDDAVMQLDDWLRNTTPPATLTPEICSSELNVICVGIPDADGKLKEADPLAEETRNELRARGQLPETGSVHLFPEPPRAAVTSEGKVVDLITAEVDATVQ